MRTDGGYVYLARVQRDTHTGEVVLYPVEDERTVEIHEGDEFVTIHTVVDLFDKET